MPEYEFKIYVDNKYYATVVNGGTAFMLAGAMFAEWHNEPSLEITIKRVEKWEEPEINPCRGCEDYDGKGGCKSNGGCGREDLEDATEIIRCSDCKHCCVDDFGRGVTYQCTQFTDNDTGRLLEVDDDTNFCSWAERKENG